MLTIAPYKERPKKRNRIRSAFHRRSDDEMDMINEKFHHDRLVQTLSIIQKHFDDILIGIDNGDGAPRHKRRWNPFRLSNREREITRFEIIRMAQDLNMPKLMTYQIKLCPHPYTDIVEEKVRLHRLRRKKPTSIDQVLVQHKPISHQKLRYRTQRILSKIEKDLKRFKIDLYGQDPLVSVTEPPSLLTLNYRLRLEQNLENIRKQIDEYRKLATNEEEEEEEEKGKSLVKEIDAHAQYINECVENYRSKLRPFTFPQNIDSRGLISTPYISRQRQLDHHSTVKKEKNRTVLDLRFNPNSFVDLAQEAEEFFGPEEPFWVDENTNATVAVQPRTSSVSIGKNQGLMGKFKIWSQVVTVMSKVQQGLDSVNEKTPRSSLAEKRANLKTHHDNSNFFSCVNED